MTAQKGFAPILIVLLIVVVVGGAAYFLGSRNSVTVTEPVTQTVQPQPTKSSETAEVAVEEIEEISSWKTFADGQYSFQYPHDWSVKVEQRKPNDEYSEVVQIINPSGSVSITISPFQYPYGFGGEDVQKSWHEKELKVYIEDKEYTAKEVTYLNSKVFTDVKIQKNKEHHILFGTGYPAGEDRLSSLTDYTASKETILKILSAFKFIE